jgi:cytochrome c oxidase subunit 4
MSVHIVPRKTYFSVFGALLVFTALTVTAATINFPGILNDVVAMTIAVCKMMLVLLFFMHVRYSSRLIWVIVASMFFWLLILLLLTLTDYTSRGWFGPNVTL